MQSLDTPPLDEAAALLSDLQGVLTCGDAVEAKVLLAQDFAAVNQVGCARWGGTIIHKLMWYRQS